jgi:hypothetical protein
MRTPVSNYGSGMADCVSQRELWVITCRGMRIVIRRSETGNPVEIGWFIGGQVAESTPFYGDVESAKRKWLRNFNRVGSSSSF